MRVDKKQASEFFSMLTYISTKVLMIPDIENVGVCRLGMYNQAWVPLEGLTLRLLGLRHHSYRICVCLKQFIKKFTVGKRVTNNYFFASS